MKLLRATVSTIVVILCASRPVDAADRGVLVPIRTFVQAANASDRALLVSAFAPDGAILDEFAPFAFPPPHAAARWFDGFGADQHAAGVTDAVISSTTPTFVSVSGERAYVVLPTAYIYRIRGKPAKETGSLAFALVRRGQRWKIATMAWAKLTDTSVP